jgi:hypothetical protein
MLIVYFCTKFHMSSAIGSLVAAIRLKVRESVWMGAILLFYILQKYYLNKSSILFQVLLLYITSGP